MAEFNLKKGPCLKEKAPIVDKDGSPKTANEYADIPPDLNSVKLGKVPFCFEISKISEIVYISEGVRTVKSYRHWRNSLRKAGCVDALVGGAASRLLAIEELESVDQFPRGSVFETSIHRKISARRAMDICFYSSRIQIELTHKPNFSNRPAPSGEEPGSKKQLPEHKSLKGKSLKGNRNLNWGIRN